MEDHDIAEHSKDIREDPFIKGLLDRIPEKVSVTFSDEQLSHIKVACGAQRGQRHPVDIRGKLNLKLWRSYYVFLMGRDRRHISRKEKRMGNGAKFFFWCAFLFFSIVLGWMVLFLARFLVHAGFGIDFIANAPSIIRSVLDLPT